MKRFTRFFSSVLAALLTFTVLVAVTNAREFDDVSATNPLLNEINYAVDNNFIENQNSSNENLIQENQDSILNQNEIQENESKNLESQNQIQNAFLPQKKQITTLTIHLLQFQDL